MSHHDHAEGRSQTGHVTSPALLVFVLGTLLVLTYLTVAVTYHDLGRLNIWIALAVAVVKASLVLLYFMHLRWDKPFNAVIVIVSLALVALFIGFALTDTRSYAPDQIRGYAPKIQQSAP